MTQRTIILLVDDIDGSEGAETLRFGVDGKSYEIDLSSENADRFRAAVEPWVQSARRVASSGRARKSSGSLVSGPTDAAKVRAWAAKNDIVVGAKGRVPSHVQDAYDAAH